MKKVNSSLIATPVENICGNPADRGKQSKSVIAKYPRSSNSGVPEKMFDTTVPVNSKSFNPSKDLLKTPVEKQ